MKIAIVNCLDCGVEIIRSDPFPDEAESKVRLTSAFAAGPCPSGCAPTFSDLNIHTSLKVTAAQGEK